MRPARCAAGACRDLGRAAAGLALCAVLASCADMAPVPSTASGAARPRIDTTLAGAQRVEDYLDQGPSPWRPASAASWLTARPDFVVAADGSGTHRTVQAAIDALPDAGRADGRRRVVRVRPGIYREIVCARDKAPFALVGDAEDPSAVRVVEGRWNARTKRAGTDPANPCDPALDAATYGTAGSATMAVFSDDVVLAGLTIANDAMHGVRAGSGYPAGAGESGGAQAVALMTRGDRILIERARLVGHQDTFYVRAPGRVLVQDSVIAGDVDFIFGDATLVVRRSTILSRAGRRAPGNGGHVLAPSTAAATRLGFLVADSRFVAEPGLAPAMVSLGRAWDHGVPPGHWQPGKSPNGQALVRDSLIGGHIGPWAASTSRRPFATVGAQANRMAEHANTDFAADPAREVLPVDGGWAAAAGGTLGGVDARPEDVYVVRNRAQLASALAAPARARIVKVEGRIDLSVDEAGRPLGAEDFRDPEFDWPAFEAAYDPATWGRRDPAGPLEDARRRSARRQAARVLLRVPSDTTLIGVGNDAALVHGGLVLDGVHNVIVRNLHVSDARDHFPEWQPRDNVHGEWNSQYDNLQLRDSRRVWVDHCTFDDGAPQGGSGVRRFGRPMVHHDGLLDITHRSDFVTVSWSRFEDHDKTMLIGSSDARRDDEGHLRVTLHHNLWRGVRERTPRVRFGRVHVHDNLFIGSARGPGALAYSIGLGIESRVISERNVWLTDPPLPDAQLVRVLQGRQFVDRGSLHNGRAIDLAAELRRAGADIVPVAGWEPTLVHEADPSGRGAERARDAAGAGRMPVAAPAAHR